MDIYFPFNALPLVLSEEKKIFIGPTIIQFFGGLFGGSKLKR